ASLLELRGAVASANRLQVGEQRADYREATQNRLNVLAKVNHREAAGLLTRVSDGLVGPVHALRLEVGNVTLRPAKMPAQLVKVAAFRVFLPLNDELVFLDSDGALWLETNFRPKTLGNEWPGKPVHRKAKIVKFPQMDIGADRAGLEAAKKL